MGGNALRRYQSFQDDNSVFVFTIDTRFTNPAGSDGSELDNQFVLPLINNSVQANSNFILRVSDGREDISVVGQAQTFANRTLTFDEPGIFQITIIGTIARFSFWDVNIDRRKIIEVNRWGSKVNFINAFYQCINLVVKATNPISLIGTNSRNMFNGIKDFEAKEAISALITNNITDSTGMFRGIQMPLKWMPNPFWNSIETMSQTFFDVQIESSVDKIEIISETLTSVTSLFWNPNNTNVRLILKTPNLHTIDRLYYGSGHQISFGEVDIRNLTSCNQLFNSVFPTSKIDATLLGWHNNFDWSDIPTIPNKVTINFANSKYSNNPDVIAAKNFLEAKGYVFTNLTME